MSDHPARPGPLRSLGLVAAFAARQVSWSRRTVFIGLLLLVPAALAIIIRKEAPPGVIEGYRTSILPNLQIFLLEILCLFYGGSLVRDAMDDRTLQFLLTRPLGRARVILGLYLGMLLFVLPLALVSAAASFAACRAGLPQGIFGDPAVAEAFTRFLLVLGPAVLVYGALFMVIGLAARHPTILGLVFILIVDGALGSVPGQVRYVAPVSYVESLLVPYFKTRASISAESGGIAGYAIAPPTAATVLGGILALCLLLLWRLARRKDFIGSVKPE